jgi:hypothetical protein
MTILLTIVTCLVVFVVQAWILPIIVGLPLLVVTGTPARLVWRTVPLLGGEDMEHYAAAHPWRIHWAAFLFRWGCIAHAVIEWGLLVWLLVFLSTRIPIVSWYWVYGVSFLIFLSSLKNAVGLNSQANSLSHRLCGGTTAFRYRHGQRDLPPDELLGPIPVTRHGF